MLCVCVCVCVCVRVCVCVLVCVLVYIKKVGKNLLYTHTHPPTLTNFFFPPLFQAETQLVQACEEYERAVSMLQEIDQLSHIEVLSTAAVVGMTTSGAAKYHQLVL